MQSMYELVGEKIDEIFDAQVVDIGDLRRGDRIVPSRTRSSAACASRRADRARRLPAQVIETRRRARRRLQARAPEVGNRRRPASARSQRCSCRSMSSGETIGVHLAPEHRPRGRLHESDVRLLTTLVEPQRRPRERAAVRRDQRQRERGAGHHQQRPAGLAASSTAGDVRPGRRQDPGDLRRPGRRHRHLRRDEQLSISRTPSSAACGSPTSRSLSCRASDSMR